MLFRSPFNMKVQVQGAPLEIVQVLSWRASTFNGVSFSPDGLFVAAAGSDGLIWIWDTSTGLLVRTLEGHDAGVTTVAWAPRGVQLASGYGNGIVRLWDASSGKLLRAWRGDTFGVNCVAWDAGGERLASASFDKKVCVWDASSGKLLSYLEGHKDWVSCVAWDPGGTRLASGSHDGSLHVWEVASAQILHKVEGHKDWVTSVAWDSDGNRLATGSTDNTLCVWDTTSGQLLRTMAGHTSWVNSVAWDPNPGSGCLASGSGDGTMRVWEASSGQLLWSVTGHKQWVESLTWEKGGERLASGSEDGTVCLWDVSSGRLLRTLVGNIGVTGVAWDDETYHLACVSGNGVLSVVDTSSGEVLRTLEDYKDWIISFAWDTTREQLAIGLVDRSVYLLDVSSGQLLRKLEGHKSSVFCVAWKAGGEFLASGSADKTVCLWEVSSGRLLHRLEGHKMVVTCVAWNAKALRLASGSRDRTVCVWDTSTGQLLHTLEGHKRGVARVAWINGVLFSTDDRGEVVAWSSEGKALARAETGDGYRDTPIALIDSERPIPLTLAGVRTRRVTLGWLGSENQVRRRSAKVVLLGDSGVGKSTLAHRLATGELQRNLPSTHGMKIWPIPATSSEEQGEIFLWDLGGQEWYRLVHQLFLGQTRVALLLFEGTRDRNALDQVRVWNGYLARQSSDTLKKVLVRSKADQPGIVQELEIEALRKEILASAYHEISSETGQGVEGLWKAVHEAIQWDSTQQVTRLAEFQRVRDRIFDKATAGQAALYVEPFTLELGNDAEVLDTVIKQCENEGMLRDIRLSSGDRVLFLRVDVADQYASSVIQLARQSPRGVPAVDERELGRAGLEFPGIKAKDRLPHAAERQAIECVCQILIQHGVCFRHQGLLVFPDLFLNLSDTSPVEDSQRVSLYYDFTGPLGNIYSSLVVALALSERFGRVRLRRDFAEFESESVRYGVRRDTRSGGRGHLDLFCSEGADRDLFVLFVEEHLKEHGIAISEGSEFHCNGKKKDGSLCGRIIPEQDIRARFESCQSDVLCPICETRHELTRGANETRLKRPELEQVVMALRSELEKTLEREVRVSQRVVAKATNIQTTVARPTRILHLTDLHLKSDSEVLPLIQPLMADLDELQKGELDYIIVSGDLVHQGQGFEKAYEFLTTLREKSGLSAERFLIVPGNHDLQRKAGRYFSSDKPKNENDQRFYKSGEDWWERDEATYAKRFEGYRTLLKDFRALDDYAEDLNKQFYVLPFPDHGLQFLLLNSAWQIDRYYPKRASLNENALHAALEKCRPDLLPIAVWHHAATGDEKIQGEAHITHLLKKNFRLVLHGDVHEPRATLMNHLDSEKTIHVVGGGAFAAAATDRPPSVPQMYNLIEIDRDCGRAKVYVRQRKLEGGAFGMFPVKESTLEAQGDYTIDFGHSR